MSIPRNRRVPDVPTSCSNGLLSAPAPLPDAPSSTQKRERPTPSNNGDVDGVNQAADISRALRGESPRRPLSPPSSSMTTQGSSVDGPRHNNPSAVPFPSSVASSRSSSVALNSDDLDSEDDGPRARAECQYRHAQQVEVSLLSTALERAFPKMAVSQCVHKLSLLMSVESVDLDRADPERLEALSERLRDAIRDQLEVSRAEWRQKGSSILTQWEDEQDARDEQDKRDEDEVDVVLNRRGRRVRLPLSPPLHVKPYFADAPARRRLPYVVAPPSSPLAPQEFSSELEDSSRSPSPSIPSSPFWPSTASPFARVLGTLVTGESTASLRLVVRPHALPMSTPSDDSDDDGALSGDSLEGGVMNVDEDAVPVIGKLFYHDLAVMVSQTPILHTAMHWTLKELDNLHAQELLNASFANVLRTNTS